MMKNRLLCAAAGLLAATMLFSGCSLRVWEKHSSTGSASSTDSSSTSESSTTDSSSSDNAASDDVTFAGPWAVELEEHYKAATSDFERSVLEDGEITDAEAADIEARVTDCLESKGATEISFGSKGGVIATIPPDMSHADFEDILAACGKGNGHPDIKRLYADMKEDPDNRG